MTRHEFLLALHRLLRPRTYLEIGVNDGRSLALAVVPDSSSTTLRDAYDGIVAANASPDPQPVPRAVLERANAVDPQTLLASGAFEATTAGRERGASSAELASTLDSVLPDLRRGGRPPVPASTMPGRSPLSEGEARAG